MDKTPSVKKSKKISTKSLSIIGMMVAVTAVLASTPLGLIPLLYVSASTIHIPTIIVAIIEGPVAGAIVGCVLGLISLFRALTAPVGILDPFFINPLISVLPRVFVGIFTAYGYRLMKKKLKKELPSCMISTAIGSMVNTIGVMGLLYILYAKNITDQLGQAAGYVFLGIVSTSGVAEMIVAMAVSTAIVLALKKVLYK